MARRAMFVWLMFVLALCPSSTNTWAETDDKKSKRTEEDSYYELYKVLADTLDQVERNYVEEVSRRELIEAAIEGVLSKLDPHSNYIAPKDLDSFKGTIEREFGGIGIMIGVDVDGGLKITSPLYGTPAYHAGLMAGDRIVQIEGESTDGITIADAVRHLKGKAGTKVKFTVVHLGGKRETVSITREIIHIQTVLGDQRNEDDTWNFMLRPDQGIGYIRLTAFSRDTARDLRRAVRNLKKRVMNGLIVDLRFNPGGLLMSAIEICDMFIPEGRIVSTKGRNRSERSWEAHGPGTLEGFPIAVLVNRYSASASEIVSACLQDHDRAVVIGERTWGKGSVQSVVDLEDGKSALKITTHSYWRPNGKNIDRRSATEDDEWGVTPNEGYRIRLRERELVRLISYRQERDILISHANPPAKDDDGDADDKDDDNPDAGDGNDGNPDSDDPDSDDPDSDDPDSDDPDSDDPDSDDGVEDEDDPDADDDQADEDSGDDDGQADDDDQSDDDSGDENTFVDRQLEKAVEYLSTSLAKAE